MPLLFKQMNLLAKPFALAAKLSAFHPIHILLATLLLTSVAYLSVMQEYFGGIQLHSSLSVADNYANFYKSDRGQWSAVEDISAFSCDHYYASFVKFQSTENSVVPLLSGATQVDGEQLLITTDSSSPFRLTAEDGGIWMLRQHADHINFYVGQVLSLYETVSGLLHGAETFDIAIVGLAYIAMYYTVFSLFFDLRKRGSRFWVGIATLGSSLCALVLALYTTTKILHREVTVLSLTEGLPFLAVTIGFRNKIKLIVNALSQTNAENIKTPTILYNAFAQEGGRLVQDHLLAMVAFTGCAIYVTRLDALSNFCVFSSLLLAFDLVLTSTFLAAALALKLEFNIITKLTLIRQALEEEGVIEATAEKVFGSDSKPFQTGVEIRLLKIAILVGFLALQVISFGSRWTSSGDVEVEVVSQLDSLSKSVLANIPNNSLLSIKPTQFYHPLKAYIQVEDSILACLRYLSVAIRDRFISKLVFFAFAVSVGFNIYLLNAARIHSIFTADELFAKSKKSKSKSKSKSSSAASTRPSTAPVAAKPAAVVSTPATVSTPALSLPSSPSESSDEEGDIRPLEECVEIMKAGNVKTLKNREIVSLVTSSKLPMYALEKQLADTTRAVVVRRKAIAKLANAPVLATDRLPYMNYDYDRVFGACCENVIGYMPLPVGVVGPLIIDGKPYHIPMATTEGCLVASAMRGCKAINAGGGVQTVLTKDGMTRGPCVSFPSLARAGACKMWLDSEEGQNKVKKVFNSTSRFARLQHIQTALAGTLLFIRFRTTTGDAMGMNMISKGVEYSLKCMVEEFGWDDMSVISVSGNYCTDKKPAAINWIEGRGKSVVAEAIIPGDVVEKVLKSDVYALVELNISKNLIGSAMAGSVGGFNAHAANLLTAVYLALGQDPAQNVESSNCITLMKEVNGNLHISVSMPSIEVGTIGGGTILDPQGAMLDLLGIRGPHPTEPGSNARQLAKIIASIVLAGELSLCSALAAGHLVQSHMNHNRKAPAATPAATPADVERLKEGSVTCIKS